MRQWRAGEPNRRRPERIRFPGRLAATRSIEGHRPPPNSSSKRVLPDPHPLQ
ncbi:hypothetical protein HMPREF3150_00328 [Pseudomonas aeruginosa]|nr:hypothetical protein HMPREF3150_00328 [Pseudomonas aeruginosa]